MERRATARGGGIVAPSFGTNCETDPESGGDTC